MNYSQLNQDLNVLKFYNNKKDGYFIEIGASDGMELSNTYLLEKEYNWKGICVEPIPSRYEKLCINRSNSNCCNRAVYHTSDMEVTFDIANEYDLLSGISEKIEDCNEKAKANKTSITVKTITFNDLLAHYNAPNHIDYLSLDTEGSELDILQSVDFNRYTFGLIDVEHNYTEPRRTKMRELLTSNGYKYVKENKWDDCYVHNSLESSLSL
jgi:FkbM family methyltransferase